MDTRYDILFDDLRGRGEAAFVPFFTLGFPSLEASVNLALVALDAGADAIEVGIPFSDPVADGPAIQLAARAALEGGATPVRCLEAIARIRERTDAPIGILTYANPVVRMGLTGFYEAASGAGADSVLVADVPIFEADPFRSAALSGGVCPIFIAPPGCPAEALEEIAMSGEGYTYVVPRSGVTGCDTEVKDCARTIASLADLGAPPCVVGFGVSRPDQVAGYAGMGAAGVICGSALSGIVGSGPAGNSRVASRLARFVSSMKAATGGA